MKKILKVFEKKGWKWACGDDPLNEKYWKGIFDAHQNDGGFFLININYTKYGSMDSLSCNGLHNEELINFQDFLERENKEVFVKGELVEVRATSNCSWYTRIFIEEFKSGYSCVSNGSQNSYNNGYYYETRLWNQIRKIPKKTIRTFELTDDEFIKVSDFISKLK